MSVAAINRGHICGVGGATHASSGRDTTNAVAFTQPRVSNPSSLVLTSALTTACSSAESRIKQVARVSGLMDARYRNMKHREHAWEQAGTRSPFLCIFE